MNLADQPAFPQAHTEEYGESGRQHLVTSPGMTLRQYYAGLFMQSVITSGLVIDWKWQNDKGDIRFLNAGAHPAEDGTNWKIVSSPTERTASQAIAYADALISKLSQP